MASWLFGVSKLTADQNSDTKDIPPVSTAVNSEPVKTLPTMPQLLYDLQPTKPIVSEHNEKPSSMLDNIPFVLSNEINMSTHNYSYNLEKTKRYLLSVKEILESDLYNYDFSNDKRLHSKLVSNKHKDSVCPVLSDEGDNHWLHCICFKKLH